MTVETAADGEPAPRIRRPLGLSFAASLLQQVCGVVTGVLLARALGPHDRGELAAVILWPGILTAIGSLGFVTATTFTTAQRRERAGTVVGTSIVVALVQSMPLVAIGVAIVPRVLSAQFRPVYGTAELFMATIPLSLLTIYVAGALNGLGHYASYQGIRLLVVVLNLVGILALLSFDAVTVRAVAVVYLLSTAVNAAAAGFLYARWVRQRLHVSASLARSMLVFGLKSHSGEMSALLNQQLDQLLISAMLGPTKLGLYVVAVTMTSLSGLIGNSVAVVALPTVAGLVGDARQALAGRFARLTIAAAVLVSAPLIVLAPYLIRFFFGSSFVPATDAARILLVAVVFLALNRALAAILTGAGRPLDAGLAEFVALGVTVAALLSLLPVLGIVGAALASLLAYAASTAVQLRRLHRTGVLPVSLLRPRGGDAAALLDVAQSLRSRAARAASR